MLHKIRMRLKLYADDLIKILDKSSIGALAGSMIAALICIFYLGGTMRTGLPHFLDLLILLLAALVFIAIVFTFSYYLYRGLISINKYIVVAIIGSCVLTFILPGEKFTRFFIFLELVSGVLIGIGLNKKSTRIVSVITILLAVVINISLLVLLLSKGADRTTPVSKEYQEQKIEDRAGISNPSQKGIYKVKRLFYGSGTDKRRSEYSKDIALKTDPVDGEPYMSVSKGLKYHLRKAYWGFDTKALPLNARVWYPEGEGTFPLVIFVHGNHLMTDYSEGGYEYLGELLASRGFIVASIDENFLNASWLDDYWFDEMNARAWLILKHLEYWQKWNNTAGNPFSGKVDMNNICLAGHSRGADAVAIASVLNKFNRYPFDGNIRLNFNFSIRSIIQIAPAGKGTGGAEIPPYIKDVNYLLLHGSHDQDIYYCAGIKTYNRLKFEPSQHYLKSFLYIYKANHGQFNTQWGTRDRDFPDHFSMNLKSLLNGDDQRRIAQIYISAFVEATLKGNKEYIPLLKDYRNGFSILPSDYYISQYEDNTFKYIADFEEDQDISTATLAGCTIQASGLKSWMEKVLPLRNGEALGQENTGVFLEWEPAKAKEPAPYYAINISDTASHRLSPDTTGKLFFFIANNNDEINQVNFSVQIKTRSCIVTKSLNDFYVMTPVLKTELAKWNYFSELKKNTPVERVFQLVQLPFSVFKEADARFDPKQIQQIRFVFDKEPKGAIILDRIGVN
ncbi:MAG TPA: hypothetical protein PKE30_10965 [Niabella sp.]|nr:hypothetical protein [Niabella sp.]